MSTDGSYAAQLLARGVENLAEVRDATRRDATRATRRDAREEDPSPLVRSRPTPERARKGTARWRVLRAERRLDDIAVRHYRVHDATGTPRSTRQYRQLLETPEAQRI